MPRGFILAIVVSDYPKIPISLEKKPRPTLIKKSVGVYGIHGYIDLNFLTITAIVKPKNRKSKASTSGDSNPLIMIF
jgi:hypothetical protein